MATQAAQALLAPTIDLTSLSYAEIREAFNDALDLCAGKLSKADWERAWGFIEYDPADDFSEGAEEFIADTALYSRPITAPGGRRRKRAIDRIAPKLFKSDESPTGALGARLPSAFFSVFQIVERAANGTVVVKDLLDGGRPMQIMDLGLAKSAVMGDFIAARFVDVGQWHIGFGIVVLLRKSEVAAILIALSGAAAMEEGRESVHELIYACRLHGRDLVMNAMVPLVELIAATFDDSDIEIDEALTMFRELEFESAAA